MGEETAYGFGGLRDGTFPPTTILRWVRWQTVSKDELIKELRHWLTYYECGQEREAHVFDGDR